MITQRYASRRDALRFLTGRGLMTPRRPFVQTPELSPAELTALCVEVGLDPPY